MRGLRRLVLLVLIMVFAASVSAVADVSITDSDNPGHYDLAWDGPFTDVLRDLHAICDAHSFAMAVDGAKPPSSNSHKGQMVSLMAVGVGGCYGRSFMWIQSIPVFTPCELPALGKACEAYSGRLIASLTPTQLAGHKTNGCVPFSALTKDQREIVAFLARNCKEVAPCPEPEFSKRLLASRVVVGMAPSIRYDFKHFDEAGKSVVTNVGMGCGSEISQAIWRKAMSDQLRANKLFMEATTRPGPDAPGDSGMCSLDGTYTLAELLRMISPAGIRTEVDANKVRIEAHCDMTGAAVARACAVATGMDWRAERDGWYLCYGATYRSVKDFGGSQFEKYSTDYQEAMPAIRQMAYDGNMVPMIDAPWRGSIDLKFILDRGTMKWSDLTPEQQKALRKSAEMYTVPAIPETEKFADLPAALPTCTFKWEPSISLYILTGDGILYHEWLRFEPLLPPAPVAGSR